MKTQLHSCASICVCISNKGQPGFCSSFCQHLFHLLGCLQRFLIGITASCSPSTVRGVWSSQSTHVSNPGSSCQTNFSHFTMLSLGGLAFDPLQHVRGSVVHVLFTLSSYCPILHNLKPCILPFCTKSYCIILSTIPHVIQSYSLTVTSQASAVSSACVEQKSQVWFGKTVSPLQA